ncbi:unnamed protein product, partial [Choristocarpus tenellus]
MDHPNRRSTRRGSALLMAGVASSLTACCLHAVRTSAFARVPRPQSSAFWHRVGPPPVICPHDQPRCNHCGVRCVITLAGEKGKREKSCVGRPRVPVGRTTIGAGGGDLEFDVLSLEKLRVTELKERYRAAGGIPGKLRKAELVSRLQKSLEHKACAELGHPSLQHMGQHGVLERVGGGENGDEKRRESQEGQSVDVYLEAEGTGTGYVSGSKPAAEVKVSKIGGGEWPSSGEEAGAKIGRQSRGMTAFPAAQGAPVSSVSSVLVHPHDNEVQSTGHQEARHQFGVVLERASNFDQAAESQQEQEVLLSDCDFAEREGGGNMGIVSQTPHSVQQAGWNEHGARSGGMRDPLANSGEGLRL